MDDFGNSLLFYYEWQPNDPPNKPAYNWTGYVLYMCPEALNYYRKTE